LQRTLTDAGFSIRIAADGSEALKILNEAHDSIDVAIIDLNLPEVSGFEVIGAITRRKTVMRVFVTTGIYHETYLEVAQHISAHIAIRKPENLADLKDWISAIVSPLTSRWSQLLHPDNSSGHDPFVPYSEPVLCQALGKFFKRLIRVKLVILVCISLRETPYESYVVNPDLEFVHLQSLLFCPRQFARPLAMTH
jgi:DNA-binding NtrC family response regulator